MEQQLNPYTTMEGLRKLPRAVVVCDICRQEVNKRRDMIRGEYVCENCGAVIAVVMMSGHQEVIWGADFGS